LISVIIGVVIHASWRIVKCIENFEPVKILISVIIGVVVHASGLVFLVVFNLQKNKTKRQTKEEDKGKLT